MLAFSGSVFRLYLALYADPRSPRGFKAMLWGALLYAVFPFDVIPDVLPIAGQLDDLVAVPLLLAAALRWIRPDLLRSAWTGVRNMRKKRNAEIIDVEPL